MTKKHDTYPQQPKQKNEENKRQKIPEYCLKVLIGKFQLRSLECDES